MSQRYVLREDHDKARINALLNHVPRRKWDEQTAADSEFRRKLIAEEAYRRVKNKFDWRDGN